MSGKQKVFKTMNKGSWRMLQDCTIYATVQRLHKAKNTRMKNNSQISICEGQLHLTGTYTQGQKRHKHPASPRASLWLLLLHSAQHKPHFS